MKTIRLSTYVLILLISLPVHAIENARNIDWDNLLPNVAPLENPFTTLTMEQLIDLETFVEITKRQRRGAGSEVNETLNVGFKLRHKLEKQGLDIDELVAAYTRLEGEIERLNQLANVDLDGQMVRIAGYTLPLEHKNIGVKELLLVPYVGACIHVPPPPANQIVYVNLKEAHILQSIYEPVWITGRLSIKATNQSLSLMDGSAGVDAAYTLDGLKFEPYQE